MNKFITLFLYLIFIASAIFSLKLIPHAPVRYLPVLELLPFVLILTSLVLGIKFNRSQLIYSTLLFSLIYVYFFWFLKSTHSQQTLTLNSVHPFIPSN